MSNTNSTPLFVLGRTLLGESVFGDYFSQMWDYYPEIIKSIREFKQLIENQSLEVRTIRKELDNLLDNVFIDSAEEDRITLWENFLGIPALPQKENETYDDWLNSRREIILARLYQAEKLNTKSISDIVSIFTGNIAESWIIDGTLYVKVYPSDKGDTLNLDKIRAELESKIPAHLNLHVYRTYTTWETIKSNFHWKDLITDFDTWDGVKYYGGDYNPNVFEYVVDEDGNSITNESNKRLFN